MESIFDKLEEKNITIYKYDEDNKLCGYELNTYTDNGVNMLIFIDYRNNQKDPLNPEDFKELFLERVQSIDVDEEIDLHRQDKLFRDNFSISSSVKDFTKWKKELLKLAKNL